MEDPGTEVELPCASTGRKQGPPSASTGVMEPSAEVSVDDACHLPKHETLDGPSPPAEAVLPISSHAEKEEVLPASEDRTGRDLNNDITPPPEAVDEAKNAAPSRTPPIQRRFLNFIRQRESTLDEISSRIKADVNNSSISDTAIKAPLQSEIHRRPELLRKVASCLAGCLTPRTSAVPDGDEQYEPLFRTEDRDNESPCHDMAPDASYPPGNDTVVDRPSFAQGSSQNVEQGHTLTSHT